MNPSPTTSIHSVAQPQSKPDRYHWFAATMLLALAAVAYQLGQYFPHIGAPIFGMVLGMLCRFVPGVARHDQRIYAPTARNSLAIAIVLLGLSLSLRQVFSTGLDALLVCAVTLSAAALGAWLLGRWLRVPPMLTVLIGIGTGICGGSAIAAVTPILKPKPEETAYAMSTIFLFNLTALLVFPAMGHWLGLSDHGFGLWAGTAINDTSSVVAAGYAYSSHAGDYATIVKLTRASLIVPVCLVIASLQRRKQAADPSVGRQRLPWFIPGFVLAAAVASSGWLPTSIAHGGHLLATGLMVLALTAIGLGTDLSRMHQTGYRLLLLGLGVSVSVAVASLLVQYGLHQI